MQEIQEIQAQHQAMHKRNITSQDNVDALWMIWEREQQPFQVRTLEVHVF